MPDYSEFLQKMVHRIITGAMDSEGANAMRILRAKIDNIGYDVRDIIVIDGRSTHGKMVSHLIDQIDELNQTVIDLEDRLAAGERKKKRATPCEAFPWKQFKEAEKNACQMFLDDLPWSEINKYLKKETGFEANTNQFTQRFYNSPPPSSLINKVGKQGAPLTWAEIWLLSFYMRDDGKKGWKSGIKHIGVPIDAHQRDAISDLAIDYKLIDACRASCTNRGKTEFENYIVPEYKDKREVIVALLLENGPKGLTRQEIRNMGGDHRRISEVQSQLKIFEVGDRFVHADYRSEHPDFWKAAQVSFGV